MTDHKQQLQSQLWNIANDLRGNMGADDHKRLKHLFKNYYIRK